MSNWSGVYTNSNSTGTSTGINGSNTLNDTTANWSMNLGNQYIKITAGLGIGQERRIAGNFPTQITIIPTWDIIPDNTSEYEICLRLENNDHIVGLIYFMDGMIVEIEDNATIFVDGNYKIDIRNATEIRWNKSKDTLVTFEPNNKEIQGIFGFWGGILLDDTATGDVKISYLRIRNAVTGFQIEPCVAFGDGSEIHHIIIEECKDYSFGVWGAGLLQDTEIENILGLNCVSGTIVFSSANESPYKMTYDKMWIEDSWGNIYWGASGVSNKIEIFKNSVFKNGFLLPTTTVTRINNADKKFYLIDNYLETHARGVYCGYTTGTDKGKIFHCRNVLKLGYEIVNGSSEAELEIRSRHNDLLGIYSTQRGLYDAGTGSEIFTSHNDFIAGRRLGAIDNIDISELVTSNNSPIMYEGLSSARTNAKSTPNKLLELDNIRESNLTTNSIKIKFDCKNSDVGTTIDQDSASGQKVLYVANTSEFDTEETVEIAFETARQETGIIDSIQDGISITLKENLAYTHTSVQADIVKKRLRNIGLGFIRYGLSADNLDMASHIPDKSSWGFLYCGFKPDIEKDNGYEWKYTDLEINIIGLKAGIKYYYQICAYTPLGDLMEGTMGDFTTVSLADNYTDPLEANVREAITYKFDAIDKTGILDLPAEVDVKDGVKYDNDTKEGTLDVSADVIRVYHPIRIDVRNKKSIIKTLVKGDTILFEVKVEIDLENFKIRAELWDDGTIDITKANTLAGGSDLEIEVTDATGGVFIVKINKGETTNIENTGWLELEIESNEGKIWTIYRSILNFVSQKIT